MRTIRLVGKVLFGAIVCGALVLGSVSLFSEVRAAGGGCICPQIYAPVKCSNGKTYTNGCYASCAHATGCVPTGPGPVEL